jgi:6-phosphogluconate dehydrogenase
MRIGMVGLGRMGANMARRLMRHGHEVVASDVDAAAVAAIERDGALGVPSSAALVQHLPSPRVVWLMVPHAFVDEAIAAVLPHLAAGDIIVDGGNSRFDEAPRRAAHVGSAGVQFVDVGTSGGVWGLERGYCLMIGGPEQAVEHLTPVFEALAPGGSGARSANRGYLYCGPSGAGHFVKMVHNAIEYGLMASYAEGFNLLERGPYKLALPDIAEVWRHGSVIGSWLLDLITRALEKDPSLAAFEGRVGDSGEGRWALHAAIDASVPAPAIAAALFARFSSRNEGDFANRLLSAMRHEFGGHVEPKN